MKPEMTVSEAADIFKEIQKQPEQLFEMICADVRQAVVQYLTAMMNTELTHFPGRDLYERSIKHKEVNHRNCSYHREFTLKETTGFISRSRQIHFCGWCKLPHANQKEY